jgi:hypothetical protein
VTVVTGSAKRSTHESDGCFRHHSCRAHRSGTMCSGPRWAPLSGAINPRGARA